MRRNRSRSRRQSKGSWSPEIDSESETAPRRGRYHFQRTWRWRRLTRRVLLVNWDNYPNVASGGVYAWAKRLVEGIPDWDFVIINQVTNPNANSSYTLPPNVKSVIDFFFIGTFRSGASRRPSPALLA